MSQTSGSGCAGCLILIFMVIALAFLAGVIGWAFGTGLHLAGG